MSLFAAAHGLHTYYNTYASFLSAFLQVAQMYVIVVHVNAPWPYAYAALYSEQQETIIALCKSQRNNEFQCTAQCMSLPM